MEAKEVFRYIGLSLLSILLVLSLITALTTTSARIYLSPGIYKETFAKNNLYDSLTQTLSNDDLSQVLPKEELEKQGNQLVDSLVGYANSEKNLDLKITIDNTLIKQTLEKRIAETPVCTTGQQPIQTGKVICRPSGVSNDVLLAQITAAKGISLDKPLVYDLSSALNKNNELNTLPNIVSTYKTIRLTAWIVTILALVAIFFLASGNPSRMRWLGIPLILTGIVCFFFQGILEAAITDKLSSNKSINSLIQSTLSDLITPFMSSLAVYSIITGLLGVILFGCSFFFKTSSENATAKSAASNKKK
jgi:hypothetical protein